MAQPSKPAPIYVTQPHLPPLQKLVPYLGEIWNTRVLTNGGPFHRQLEQALCEYLGVPYISLFCNATLALVTALQSLRITGEVITTPYSFVATAHSLLWNGIRPVFVDIDPVTLNIDPTRIEAAITPQTTAIMPVHCYGHPCDTAAIDHIAEMYNLRVIYDAAHAFGVQANGQSILNQGDLSVLSFHATKVFNTFEGGAVIARDARAKQRLDHLKNFGFADETTVVAPGINGKMSELNAAIGLLQLQEMDAVFAARAAVAQRYRDALGGVPGLRLVDSDSLHVRNHSYFPVLVGAGFPLARDAVYARLKAAGIHARRYFHPLISQFPMYRGMPSAAPDNLPVATRTAREVLCLPIYPGLSAEDQGRVIDVLMDCAGQRRPHVRALSTAS